MRLARYLPFTFLSGAHGFALFAPYLVAVMAVSMLWRRRPQPIPVAVRVHHDVQPSLAS